MKECANELAPSLCMLLKEFIALGKLPLDWKTEKTSPKCSRKEINHSLQIIVKFHYLTLLSIVNRLCERFMPQKLLPDIIHLLSDLQHGYVEGRSCVTQLLSVLHELGASLDAGKDIDDICLDFSKAFPIANFFVNWLCLVITVLALIVHGISDSVVCGIGRNSYFTGTDQKTGSKY